MLDCCTEVLFQSRPFFTEHQHEVKQSVARIRMGREPQHGADGRRIHDFQQQRTPLDFLPVKVHFEFAPTEFIEHLPKKMPAAFYAFALINCIGHSMFFIPGTGGNHSGKQPEAGSLEKGPLAPWAPGHSNIKRNRLGRWERPNDSEESPIQAERSRDVVGGPDRQNGHGHIPIQELERDFPHSPVAAGDDHQLAGVLKRPDKVVGFRRLIVDPVAGAFQLGDELAPGDLLISGLRPCKAISAGSKKRKPPSAATPLPPEQRQNLGRTES